MEAAILAGGLGTRLRPVTERVPKPMVPILGRPYLEYQIELLREQQITDIVLLVGYLAEQIEDYFGDGARHGVSIRYSREPMPLGTGGALKRALPLLSDAFLVLNGDSLLPVEYRPVFDALDASGAEAVICAYDNQAGDTGVPHNICVDSSKFVTRYDKSGTPPVNHVDAGVIAVRARVLEPFRDEAFSLERDCYPRLIERRHLAAYLVRERFYDMGTPAGLAMLERFLKR